MMDFIILLQTNQVLALFVFGILGLCVGSFLNVVIHRLPLQMFYEWRQECPKILADQEDIGADRLKEIQSIVDKDIPITLSNPPSRCPQCNHQIRWYENIPVISWLVLLGKCSNCKAPISIRYPFVEILTAVLSVVIIYKFQVSWSGISALILIWTLIALAGIDFDTQLLPDRLTTPLVGLGLVVNSFGLFTSPIHAIWGLVGGYLSLWLVTRLFEVYLRYIKKINDAAMGMGDFKLFAVLGAWFGFTQLPFMLIVSCFLGLIVGGALLIKNKGKSLPYAFGPYIAISGVIVLLFGITPNSF